MFSPCWFISPFQWVFNDNYITVISKRSKEFTQRLVLIYSWGKVCFLAVTTDVKTHWRVLLETNSWFIISYFNDYLARCIQHDFTGLSLQPGDMVVKLGLILPKEDEKKRKWDQWKDTHRAGGCWGKISDRHFAKAPLKLRKHRSWGETAVCSEAWHPEDENTGR